MHIFALQMIMEPKEIQHIYAQHPGVDALMQLSEEGGKKRVFLEGLLGSSAATTLCGLKQRAPEQTMLVVMNDAETAGYFYHDMMQLTGDSNILFFPSSFRRAMKYGQEDDANRILRTEVMSRLTNRRRKEGLLIVTHPDALAEKVASQSDLEKKTLSIAVGDSISRDEVEKRLGALDFKEVTYVYEPGEFAVRGSIIDIFSFSSEFPYRIDFFGDEVDSIRTFEVESQLSRERVEEANIVPKVTGKESVAITSFLPKNCILITKDIEYIKGSIEKLRNEGFTLQAKLSEENADYAGTASSVGIAGARAVRAAVGHALATRFEHPVPEDANRVMDRLGLRSLFSISKLPLSLNFLLHY